MSNTFQKKLLGKAKRQENVTNNKKEKGDPQMIHKLKLAHKDF